MLFIMISVESKMSKDFNFLIFSVFLFLERGKLYCKGCRKKNADWSECIFPCNLQAGGYTCLNLLQYSIQAVTLKNPPAEQTASN